MNTFIVHVWLRLARPRLLSELRYAQRILERMAACDTSEERGVLHLMALGAYESIDVQLADVTAGYPSAGPVGRRTIIGVEGYASRVLRRLHEQALCQKHDERERRDAHCGNGTARGEGR